VDGVCGDTLDAVEAEFAQVSDFFGFGQEAGGQDDLMSLNEQTVERGCGCPCCSTAEIGRDRAGFNGGMLVEIACGVTGGYSLVDEGDKPIGIEVDVSVAKMAWMVKASISGSAAPSRRARCAYMEMPLTAWIRRS
jgi:hypothetical protein